MAPQLRDEIFVFCTLSSKPKEPVLNEAILRFEENEGTTLLVPQAAADAHGLAYEGTWRMITLNVHSSLEAVGFLAALLPRLADKDVSTNVISAFYHDHILVPAQDAHRALAILRSLTRDETQA